jgi:hypothetical protein
VLLGRPGQRAQAVQAQKTIRDGSTRSGRPVIVIVRDGLFPPLTGARAKAPLEAGIEEAQVVETAFTGHVDDFGVRVPQQGHRFGQAQFHPEGGNGNAKVLVKQTVEVAPG